MFFNRYPPQERGDVLFSPFEKSVLKFTPSELRRLRIIDFATFAGDTVANSLSSYDYAQLQEVGHGLSDDLGLSGEEAGLFKGSFLALDNVSATAVNLEQERLPYE
ncbi:MAG TPA: hypothetical protein VLE51_01695 [Candidatus Saccharimonadales bacterium]|nr:hypothetical protein [Candidatus Saccharimonadales bacterium]